MPTRYAESYGDTVYVLGEFTDKDGWLQGLYVTEITGKIVLARDVKLTDDGDIEYWGRGIYGAASSNTDWLKSLSAFIEEFEKLKESIHA